MNILKEIWEGNMGSKFTKEGTPRCWGKAEILPIYWKLDIENEVGRASIAQCSKVVIKEIFDELCGMMRFAK